MYQPQSWLFEQGRKPSYEIYCISGPDLSAVCSKIIEQTTMITDVVVTFDVDEEHDNEIRTFLSPKGSQTDEDFTDRQRKTLERHGFDVEDYHLTTQTLIKHLTGSSLSYICYSRLDYSLKIHFFDIVTPARQHLQKSLRQALDHAVYGTRDNTILALHNLIKDNDYSNFDYKTGEDRA